MLLYRVDDPGRVRPHNLAELTTIFAREVIAKLRSG
jgi:hypothetical protein